MKDADKCEPGSKQADRMEELDQVLRVVRPRTWVALLTVGVVVLLAIVWGFTGQVSTRATGQGILMKSGILFPVVAIHEGQITEIGVEPGMEVRAQDTLARLDQPLLRSELREARSMLDVLREDQARLEKHEREYDALIQEHLEKQRGTIMESIRIGRELVQGQRELVESMAELVERGTISRLDLEKQKAELRQVQIQLLEDEQALVKIAVEENLLAYEVDERLSDLLRMMLPVEEHYISLEEQLKTHSVVLSPHDGTVVELHKNPGDMVRLGESVALLELAEAAGEPADRATRVVAYVSSFQGMTLQVGMTAHVVPETVREEEYGVLIGEVIAISPYPVSRAGMMRILGNEEWVQALVREGAPTMVTIRLHPDERTMSGYRWSSGSGPPGPVKSGAQCVVRILARRQAPIDLVIPQLKRRLFGVGEGTY
jgi:HlyD family secretion protein